MKNILYTRLIRPKSRNLVIRNKNIQDKLNTILENKLTVVKGSAAVGKSTLISDYISDKNNYMWLSLDENSDNISSFWTYIIYGLKDNIEDLNSYTHIVDILVNRDDIYELISSLINELIHKDELFIVLDDFHYIKDQFLVKTIEYFISNSSDNIHFIFISRHDIPLYLGNILMKGGIVNISGEDLYLTLKETKEFIKNSNNNIDNELIKEIYLNTEGWIGAIKLLLTLLNNNKNIKNIPKNNKLFIDYMNKEIINSLSKNEINFLIQTSLLNYVNPKVYGYIDNKDGFEIIEKLIEKNMLIITIDEEKRIYRYHNVLRQHLIELFDKYEENLKNEIIDKITSFLIDDNNYDEAISIFLNWNRYEEALKLVESNAHNIISNKILNDFPLEYYSNSVDLAFISSFFNYLNLDYERCSLIINSIKCDNNELLNCIKLFNIILDNFSMQDFYMELPKQIDNNLNILTKTIYYMLASLILGIWGNYKKALEMINLIKESNKNLKNSYIDLVCEYNKVSLLEDMGRLNESEMGYIKLNECIINSNYKSCFRFFSNIGLPGVYIKKLMDKSAEKLLLEANKKLCDFSNRAVFHSLKQSIQYNLAEVKYIQGNIDECEKLLDNLNSENKEGYGYIQVLALKIRLLSTENKIKKEEYDEFINAYEKNYKNSIYASNIGITYGIVLFNSDRYEDSLEIFNNIVFTCRKNSIGYLLVYSLLWKAIILNKLNYENERECLNIIKEAIFYSRKEDILFPYYMNRKYLKEIIKKFETPLLEDKDNKTFMRKLNIMINENDKSEILSSREIEVLKALTDGLSNKEIGEKLFISISTVKTHIINIYGKLEVKNRVEAVNEGRKLFDL